jgi:hypothetical protein
LPSTCVSATLLLDPLSPGEFSLSPSIDIQCLLLITWNVYAINLNPLKWLKWLFFYVHISRHRFRMLLIEMSHLRIPLMLLHHRHTHKFILFYGFPFLYTHWMCFSILFSEEHFEAAEQKKKHKTILAK